MCVCVCVCVCVFVCVCMCVCVLLLCLLCLVGIVCIVRTVVSNMTWGVLVTAQLNLLPRLLILLMYVQWRLAIDNVNESGWLVPVGEHFQKRRDFDFNRNIGSHNAQKCISGFFKSQVIATCGEFAPKNPSFQVTGDWSI